MPRCPKTSGTGTGTAGKPKKKKSLIDKLFSNEATARKRSMKFGIKSALSTIASFFMLKKILGKLEESSGYLGAVFKILGVAFKMALMPIATVLGAFLMPYTLQILDVVRNMLVALKGPLADLIGGKISVSKFLEIALPTMAEAFGEIGSILGDMVIGFFDLIETVWPMVEPYFIKAFSALCNYIEENAGRFGNIFGKILMVALPLAIIGVIRALPTILLVVWEVLRGTFLAFVSKLGISFGQFLVGFVLLIAGFITALAILIAVIPSASLSFGVALAVALGTLIVLISTKLVEFAYNFGVTFGTFISNLRSKLSAIPGIILSAVKGALKIGGGSSSRAKNSKGNLVSNLLSKLPHFAEGGVATKPTAGIFGEAGPEALVPLKKGGMGNNYTFNISIDQPQISSDMDLDEVARRVSDQIYSNVRRSTSW